MNDTIALTLFDTGVMIVIAKSAVIYVQNESNDGCYVGLVNDGPFFVKDKFAEIMKQLNPYWDVE